MNGHKLTHKQFSALIVTSLLSPMLRSLPRAVVSTAGRGAWLSAAPAFLLLFVMLIFQSFLLRQLRPGEGYSDLLLRWLGPIFGRIVLLIYWAFFLFYAGFILRSGTERLVAAIYPESPLFPFMLIMLGLFLTVSLGTLRAVGRTAFLLQSFLLTALALVLIFAMPNISWENLTPIPRENAGGIFLGAFPLAFIGGLAGTFPFLMGYVETVDRPVQKSLPTVLAMLVLACILCLEVVGTFGAALTEKLGYPFFIMVRDISIFHITQRIEAVVVVLWMFTDFILCTSMLRCAYETIRTVFCLPDPETEPLFSPRLGRWVLWLEGAIVLAFGYFIARSAFELEVLADRIVPALGFCFIYIGMALAWCVGWIRGRLSK